MASTVVAILACAGFTIAQPLRDAPIEKAAAADNDVAMAATAVSQARETVAQGALLSRAADVGARGGPVAARVAKKQARQQRIARLARMAERLLRSEVTVKVGYFNMLGCYHTDRDEPSYGHLAYGFASCGSRMPRQFDWLRDNGVSIAGIGEFQGKAWRVLSSYNAGHDSWGIYPTGQSGPYGQNPVVWRNSEWELERGEQIGIPYNCSGGGSCRASSTLVRLKHKVTGRAIQVLNTHHTVDGGGGGAGRRAAARGIELGRIADVRRHAPVIYMGDFNSVGAAASAISPTLDSAFTGGMGIDQIWGTSGLTFSETRYDSALRALGLTDHGSGIALTMATLEAIPESPKSARSTR